jgi:hypothetical protein
VSLSAQYPHRIRLRGPWECEPIDGPLPRRVIMPGRWLDAGLEGFHGSARFARKFGYPGKIDESEHVWLTCDGCTGCHDVRVNGQLLAAQPGETFAFEVTSILATRNRLEVLVRGDSPSAGLWGEVALEIRKDAFLSDMMVERRGASAVVSGLVVGRSPQPLELYVLVDGRHVDYRTVLPTAEETPIRIELAELAQDSQIVRVDLIQISSIWYTVELPIPHWKSS